MRLITMGETLMKNKNQRTTIETYTRGLGTIVGVAVGLEWVGVAMAVGDVVGGDVGAAPPRSM